MNTKVKKDKKLKQVCYVQHLASPDNIRKLNTFGQVQVLHQQSLLFMSCHNQPSHVVGEFVSEIGLCDSWVVELVRSGQLMTEQEISWCVAPM